jgi:hypothetical protein
MSNIFILSQPRSGSSMLAGLIKSSGYKSYTSKNSSLLSSSSFNKDGYFEDIKLMLLNDQILRALYGLKYSFLYPPPNSRRVCDRYNFSDYISDDFTYDINENTLFMPDRFAENPSFYTGASFDVWGLTRMIKGEKWYKCYKNFEVLTKKQIISAKMEFEEDINSGDNLVIKDPRLSLTLENFNFSSKRNKFIFLKREPFSTIHSMRKHYGQNMFSERYIKNTQFISNHFNHKIKFLNYLEFGERYEFCHNFLEEYLFINISYENLINKMPSEIKLLENFIEANIDLSLIH